MAIKRATSAHYIETAVEVAVSRLTDKNLLNLTIFFLFFLGTTTLLTSTHTHITDYSLIG